MLGLPYLGIRDAEEGSVALWRLAQEIPLVGLDRFHVVTLYTNDNTLVHFRTEVDGPEAMIGAKVRAAGPAESRILKAMGATPVGMPITEVAQSMNTGVIDGMMATWGSMASFRLEPLAKSTIFDTLGVRPFIIAINQDVYDSLSDKAKAAINDLGGESLSRAMGQVMDAGTVGALSRAEEARADTIFRFTPEQSAERAAMFDVLKQKWIETNVDGAHKMDTLQRILTEIRNGS